MMVEGLTSIGIRNVGQRYVYTRVCNVYVFYVYKIYLIKYTNYRSMLTMARRMGYKERQRLILIVYGRNLPP